MEQWKQTFLGGIFQKIGNSISSPKHLSMECLITWVQLGYRGMSTDMGHWWSIHWGQNAEPLKLQVTGTFGFWVFGPKGPK